MEPLMTTDYRTELEAKVVCLLIQAYLDMLMAFAIWMEEVPTDCAYDTYILGG